MEEICAELEGAERRSVVSSVLHRIHEPQPNDEYEGDVLDIVAAAWDEDQAKILDAKYAVIRQVCDIPANLVCILLTERLSDTRCIPSISSQTTSWYH